jgi:hypothetical protein
MSNRRKTKPGDTARRDQAGAWVRDHVAGGGIAIVSDYAEPGMACGWCDCPLPPHDPASPHRDPSYSCDRPCRRPARHVITVSGMSPRPVAFRVCGPHDGELHQALGRLLRATESTLTIAQLRDFA